MKSLHKKIGAMVLVFGLLLGAGCLSGGSVVHANSDLLSRVPQHQKDSIGSIVNGGGRIYKCLGVYKNSFEKEEHFNVIHKKIDDGFINLLRDVKRNGGGAKELGLQRGKFYELHLEGFNILIQVW